MPVRMRPAAGAAVSYAPMLYGAARIGFADPKFGVEATQDVAVVTPRGRSYSIYVATATGGLWKTENEATTWTPIFDQGPSTAIGDVAIAPSNPNVVWIGTGEANIFRSSNAGIGVYKSLDAGKTWQHVGLAGTSAMAASVRISDR